MISPRSMKRAAALMLILTTAGCAQISGLFQKPAVEVVGPSSICSMALVKMTDAEHDDLRASNREADTAIRANNGAILDCRARAQEPPDY